MKRLKEKPGFTHASLRTPTTRCLDGFSDLGVGRRQEEEGSGLSGFWIKLLGHEVPGFASHFSS